MHIYCNEVEEKDIQRYFREIHLFLLESWERSRRVVEFREIYRTRERRASTD